MADFSGRVPTFKGFVREQDRIDWLVQGLLANVGWTLLVGSKGVGKTTLALQLCAALEEGKSFLDQHTKQAHVLYIQLDSPELEWREIARRVVPESLGRTMVNAPMFCLDNPSYIAAMADLIQKTQPGFIVWDSLYKLSNKNKINTDSVLNTIYTLDLLATIGECTVPYMVLHHPPHGESRASGHNSLAATCSNEWVLTKTKLRIEKGRILGDKLVQDGGISIEREKRTPGLWRLYQENITEDVTDNMLKGRNIQW